MNNYTSQKAINTYQTMINPFSEIEDGLSKARFDLRLNQSVSDYWTPQGIKADIEGKVLDISYNRSPRLEQICEQYSRSRRCFVSREKQKALLGDEQDMRQLVLGVFLGLSSFFALYGVAAFLFGTIRHF
jgi:hypothetical protein